MALIDVEKFKTTPKSMKDINGTTLCPEREGGKGGSSGKYQGPDVNKLRVTTKDVSSIAGAVTKVSGS